MVYHAICKMKSWSSLCLDLVLSFAVEDHVAVSTELDILPGGQEHLATCSHDGEQRMRFYQDFNSNDLHSIDLL